MPESVRGNENAVPEAPPKFKFFVYIIESPSAPDIYHGRSEGALVAQAIRLDGIPCVIRTAINLEAFKAALLYGLSEVMKMFPGHYPILHLSAHGGEEGIQLSSNETITWAELRDFLVPINSSLNGTLLLCMSTCKGYSACRMAMEVGDMPHPYFAMIGNFGTPTWPDTSVAYMTFYHLIAKGQTIPDAVIAMRAASGDHDWVAETAEMSKQGYIEFVKNQVQATDIQRELENVADEAQLPPDAKALESGESSSK